MKKLFFPIILFSTIFHVNAKVLPIPVVIQEQDQWCWAGVSKAILSYYGINKTQCQIAEYTRTTSILHDFGSTDCCMNPDLGCNYPNYNYGTLGSVQEILYYFGKIENYGKSAPLSLIDIVDETDKGHPFVIRWGWKAGGGHFVIGHGVSDSDVYYMNPAPGEGAHISTYDWLIDDGNHTWTHTNVITTGLSLNENKLVTNELKIFPNPAENELTLETKSAIEHINIYNCIGQKITLAKELQNSKLDVSQLPPGIYFIEVLSNDEKMVNKFIKN